MISELVGNDIPIKLEICIWNQPPNNNVLNRHLDQILIGNCVDNSALEMWWIQGDDEVDWTYNDKSPLNLCHFDQVLSAGLLMNETND